MTGNRRHLFGGLWLVLIITISRIWNAWVSRHYIVIVDFLELYPSVPYSRIIIHINNLNKVTMGVSPNPEPPSEKSPKLVILRFQLLEKLIIPAIVNLKLCQAKVLSSCYAK
jgi:hypothetical protein